jgi:soluble lytic murein transglycosylase-like protein
MRQWRTVSALVQVRDGDGPWSTPALDISAPGVSARLASTLPTARLADGISRRYRVPLAWVMGFVYVESGGDPRAVGGDGEKGLMQIMPSTAVTLQRDPARLFEPAYNLETGCDLLAGFRVDGFDLPTSASGYNGGLAVNGRPHISSKSPWGMREVPHYIDRIVAVTNHYTRTLGARTGSAAALGFGAVAIGTLLFVLNRQRRG